MKSRLKEVERQEGRLSPEEREHLSERLLQDLDNAPLSEVEEAWVKAAERRFEAWQKGERKGIPAASALTRMRRGLSA